MVLRKELDLWDQKHLTSLHSSYVKLDIFLTSLRLRFLIYNITLMVPIVIVRVHWLLAMIAIGKLNRKRIYWKDVGEIHRIYRKAINPELWMDRQQGCHGGVQEAEILHNLFGDHCYNKYSLLLIRPPFNYSDQLSGSWKVQLA